MSSHHAHSLQAKTLLTPLAVALACGSAFAPSASAFEVIDLGRDVSPTDISNTGVIVGSCHANQNETLAFRYGIYDGSLDIIASGVVANGVNDAGQVTGNTSDGAFLYDGGRLLTWQGYAGNAINEGGSIAGHKSTTNPYRPAPLPLDPAVYDGNRWLVLNVAQVYSRGTRRGIYADQYDLVDINTAGYAVGSKSRYGLTGSTAILTTPLLGEIQYLPTGYGSVAAAINDQNQIVGTTGQNTRRAYLYDYGTYGLTGQPVDLGSLAGSLYSEAMDINEWSQVVGSSSCEACSFAPDSNRAFLWENGAMTDLNDLVAGSPGWVLTDAVAINDQGDIVGTGLLDGQSHGFLLTSDSATVQTAAIDANCTN
jgi:probable HAF family extracellular repeat protein